MEVPRFNLRHTYIHSHTQLGFCRIVSNQYISFGRTDTFRVDITIHECSVYLFTFLMPLTNIVQFSMEVLHNFYSLYAKEFDFEFL
jgi:hypothetical protein